MIREQTGMNQNDFASYLDLRPGSYSDIKRSKNGISRNVLRKMEKKLKVNAQWMLTGIGDITMSNEDEGTSKALKPMAPYKTQSNEGVNAYFDKLFKIIERRDEQIDKLLLSLKERDEMDKNSIGKILAKLESS
jgi:transcriptional regulator with XRE-family HTH domain